jgi:hypothetical protein
LRPLGIAEQTVSGSVAAFLEGKKVPARARETESDPKQLSS